MITERVIDGPVPLHVFRLPGQGGFAVEVCNFGATVTSIEAPDRDGVPGKVVLGMPDPQDYVEGTPYFGAAIGRCANRIANGQFVLDSQQYQLSRNEAPHHLHGGWRGFDKRLWEARIDGDSLLLAYDSEDGEEGYPGVLRASVRYAIQDGNTLSILIEAQSDRATPANMTNHSYFNLSGQGSIDGHWLWIDAAHYMPVDEALIPSGEIDPVLGTDFDFQQLRAIGTTEVDHNFVLRPQQAGMRMAARLFDPASGRMLEVFTDKPGIQFYSGDQLDGSLGFARRAGLCLEPQGFPNAVNVPEFPSVILRPGETYRHAMAFRFLTG